MDLKKKAELLKKYKYCLNLPQESENTNDENNPTTFNPKPIVIPIKWEDFDFSQNIKYTPQCFFYGRCNRSKKGKPEDKINVPSTSKTQVLNAVDKCVTVDLKEDFSNNEQVQDAKGEKKNEKVKEVLKDGEEKMSTEDIDKLLDLLLELSVDVKGKYSYNDQEINFDKDENLKGGAKNEKDDQENSKDCPGRGKKNNDKLKLVKWKNHNLIKIPQENLQKRIPSFTVKSFYESISEIKDIFRVIGFCKFFKGDWCLFSHCKSDELPGILLNFQSALRLDQLDIEGSSPVQIHGCLKLRDAEEQVGIIVSGCVTYELMDDFLAGVKFTVQIEHYVSKQSIEEK